jgi:serine/threonine-protein kinase
MVAAISFLQAMKSTLKLSAVHAPDLQRTLLSELDARAREWSDGRRGDDHPTKGRVCAPTVPELPEGVREGAEIAGKYRIEKVIGGGAMGTVVAAHHLMLERRVAIKFLTAEALEHSESVARFLREARAAARITSEHVARVQDVAVLESGAPYIVMEYLEGCDLAQWLTRRGPIPVQQAVDFILQACDAIAEAHELGIIHRDVKPANLFAVQQQAGVVQSIKVLDFGISKTDMPLSSTLAPADCPPGSVVTQEKAVIGSPYYMSPEQMESARDVDQRTDIWAVGVTLFQLLSGKLPFEGKSLLQVYSLITSGPPPSVRELARPVPVGLDEALHTCLQRNRENRYTNVAELAAALAPFGSSRATSYLGRIAQRASAARGSTRLSPTGAPPGGAGRTLAAASDANAKRPKPATKPAKRRGVAALLVAGSAMIVGGGVYSSMRHGDSMNGSPGAAGIPAASAPAGTFVRTAAVEPTAATIAQAGEVLTVARPVDPHEAGTSAGAANRRRGSPLAPSPAPSAPHPSIAAQPQALKDSGGQPAAAPSASEWQPPDSIR